MYTTIAASACFATTQGTKGVATPENMFPSGVDSTTFINPYTGKAGYTRKATIGSTIANIALLNKLMSEKTSPQNAAKIQEAITVITPLLSSLQALGVFDFFIPEEWIATATQPGRVLVAVLYLQQYPENITAKIEKRLLQIQSQTQVKILADSIAKALNNNK